MTFCDTLSLADVFEKLWNNSLENDGLCSSHYLSGPGLSCDAMLKMTKTKFELVPDPDMYKLLEKGTRDAVSYISISYCEVNNKYLKSYYPKQELKHIINLDTNNLYGYAKFNFFAASRLKWIDSKEYDLNKYTSNSSKGFALEVDLKYSKKNCKNYTMIILYLQIK